MLPDEVFSHLFFSLREHCPHRYFVSQPLLQVPVHTILF